MGDSEFVTKLDCVTAHRQMDAILNEREDKIRADFKNDLEKVYAKMDRLFWAGVVLIITSLVSIALTFISMSR